MWPSAEDCAWIVKSWSWLVPTSVCALSFVYLLWHRSLVSRHWTPWSPERTQCKSRALTGPTVFPVLGCLPQILWNSHRIYDWITDELKKTRSQTMRSEVPGLKFVETANPANVEHMLKGNFSNYPKGDVIRGMFQELLGLGIFNADGSSWKLQRKVASPEFSRRSLRDLALKAVQKELSDRLIPVLDSACASATAAVDLQDLLLRFTFDTACQVAFGVDYESLNPSKLDYTAPFAQAFDDAVLLSSNRWWGTFPPWRVQRFLDIGSERKLRQALLIVDRFALSVIDARRQELARGLREKQDLLSRFMAIADEFVQAPEIRQKIAEDPRSKRAVSAADLFLRDVVTGFLLAGRDTSACGLTWFFWLLSSHPHVRDAILKEIATTLASRKLPEQSSNSDAFSFEEVKDMHYLQAALIEAMRLYPPVPDDAKQAAADDVWPDGTVIAKGTVVSFCIFAMGRNAAIWGDDCTAFRPERHLRDGVYVAPSPFSYPVFQAGPRTCLGMDMALIQMKLIAATLINRYEYDVQEGHCAKYDLALTMKILKGLPVHVRRREC